jgi:TolB-like protein
MMRKSLRLALALVLAAGFLSCATGKPLVFSDLNKIGWENTASFQCYLSAELTLKKLPDPSGAVNVSFDPEGAARVENARWTITLPASLQGRIVKFHERDQYLYVAFEDGDAALPFAKDRNDRFSLAVTVDSNYENGVEFVDYEGVRYKPEYFGSNLPWLNVVIEQTDNSLRRQMQGSQARAASAREDAVNRISKKFIAALPEGSAIAVLNISTDDNEAAAFVAGELEHQLVESNKFKIVDRKSLDALRSERDFQLSGNVSDESAISIGNMLGANIVITGDISGSGTSHRLYVKALDVTTGEIVSSGREPL